MEGVEDVEEVVTNAFTTFLQTYQVPLTILAIIVVAVLLNWLLRKLLMRTVTQIVRGVKKAQDVDTTSEIQAAPYVNARAVQRTRTLGSVGRVVITWTIVVISMILILGQLGVNLAALLTSAGIVAAGLAFGAQNLVKDILNGIFMVFEDQLGVGDVVTIGEVSGTVEDVGIRVTQVRAMDGTLWFVRNGEILTLGNSSQGWGRALIDITVRADSDLDRVEEVTLEAARELLKSPSTARKVTGEPELWGVESAFGDRATLRLAVRTRPEAQWAVQRALRASLMRHFNEAGIKLAEELPRFPGGAA
ncbi:mechanosensitive ion channel family protein [Leucobacter ruminantium]|uniref:Mechanosensitive ion channel family protein n=1 Tax=Leucobacter ruminantium TaxID=1289170 RepID=A0A939LWF6_9MICO|nr:mechanosensitive ion channel family protein [Leucobacter ruminantium]MBO1805691.1 mechanosensitive ion channel family protein [Leucobacter ruminantium]